MPTQVYLKPGREKSLQRRHPWVYSGAVARVVGEPRLGETLPVFSAAGQFLGQGAYSPHSQIRLRIWTWDAEQRVDVDFLRSRIQAAIQRRQHLGLPEGAVRLVYAESDGLPGLVVDRYANTLVVQLLSAGVECWREQIADLLQELTGLEHIFERSDAEVRSLEGLPERVAVLRGTPPPETFSIEEHGLRFQVDLQHGHKTGFYLDQRANRLRVRALAEGRRVLDCFSYTGGFSLNALLGGAAQVVAVDVSDAALAMGRSNCLLNSLDAGRIEWQNADVFQYLRKQRDRGEFYDLIILDPPKFAPTAAHARKAARGYKDINLWALKLLAPGGLLFTFSCSGGIDADLFQKIVAGAALDAGVEARILANLWQDVDHLVALNYPESAYLKGLLVTVG
ncbi:MAG: class I SAM-dependent methyltransferase [Anaerolineales bacterium]|nr:class I SAM-dependent methyltransferase [Anaerolineales bacterium]